MCVCVCVCVCLCVCVCRSLTKLSQKLTLILHNQFFTYIFYVAWSIKQFKTDDLPKCVEEIRTEHITHHFL